MRGGRSPGALLLLTLSLASSLARAQESPSTSPPPQAKPAEDAKSLFQRGQALYALGRYAEAAPLFERAFEIKPVPALLFNAAQAHRFAGNRARALTLYESYLQLYNDPTRRPEVEALIAELKAAIAAQPPAPATASEPPTAPPTPATALTAPAPEPPRRRPGDSRLWRRWWFWTAAGGVVAVGLGVGLGVGLYRPPPATVTSDFGTVRVF